MGYAGLASLDVVDRLMLGRLVSRESVWLDISHFHNIMSELTAMPESQL